MEVRFDSEIDDAAVFGVIYNSIKSKFPKADDLPILQFPAQIRKADPTLKYLPYYRLVSKENPNVLIQIGPKVFSVIVTNDYTGWTDFLKEIKYGLECFQQSGVDPKISRFALRYLNFIEGNILTKSHLSIKLEEQSFLPYNSQMRIELPGREFISALSINNNVVIEKAGMPETRKSGSIIDIDTYVEKPLPNFFAEKDTWLDNCHRTEKKLFFSLLTEDYANTLKEVIYE